MEIEVLETGKTIFEEYVNSDSSLSVILKKMGIENDYGRRAMYGHVIFNVLKVKETLKNLDRLDIFENYKPYLALNYAKYIKKNTKNLKNITDNFIAKFNYIFLTSFSLNEKDLRMFMKMYCELDIFDIEETVKETKPVRQKNIEEIFDDIKPLPVGNSEEIIEKLQSLDSDNKQIKAVLDALVSPNYENSTATLKEDLSTGLKGLSNMMKELGTIVTDKKEELSTMLIEDREKAELQKHESFNSMDSRYIEVVKKLAEIDESNNKVDKKIERLEKMIKVLGYLVIAAMTVICFYK